MIYVISINREGVLRVIANGYIRKDKSPEDTINLIKEILKENNIETEIACWHKNENIFSCRLVIKGTNIGTNGKGISEKCALASAYAEFMERLQTGYLFGKSYSGTSHSKQHQIALDVESALSELQNLFPSSKNDSDDKYIKELLSKVEYYEDYINYHELTEDKYCNLPNELINYMCGSNGLCAGNTFYEAVNQGICENFERLVLKDVMCFKSDYPTIPDTFYRNMLSYKLIQVFDEKGYSVVVKDCTLGGKYPVVGILVVEKKKRKMKFSIGSDVNFDIALQRCLTEVIQGYNIDDIFENDMLDVYHATETNIAFEFSEEKLEWEHHKAVTKGTGIIPEKFYLSKSEFNEEFIKSAFNNEAITNKTAYTHLINLARNENFKIYVKDYSFLGFPTYRTFLTNDSRIIIKIENQLKYVLALKTLNQYNFDNFDVKTFADVLHMYNISCYYENAYKIEKIISLRKRIWFCNDTRMLEVICELIDCNYSKALALYVKFFKKNKCETFEHEVMYIKSLANDCTYEYKNWLKSINDEQGLRILDRFDKVLRIARTQLKKEKIIRDFISDKKSNTDIMLGEMRVRMNEFIHRDYI